jgi:hypothetical protein
MLLPIPRPPQLHLEPKRPSSGVVGIQVSLDVVANPRHPQVRLWAARGHYGESGNWKGCWCLKSRWRLQRTSRTVSYSVAECWSGNLSRLARESEARINQPLEHGQRASRRLFARQIGCERGQMRNRSVLRRSTLSLAGGVLGSVSQRP